MYQLGEVRSDGKKAAMSEGKHAGDETLAGGKRHLRDDPRKSLKCTFLVCFS